MTYNDVRLPAANHENDNFFLPIINEHVSLDKDELPGLCWTALVRQWLPWRTYLEVVYIQSVLSIQVYAQKEEVTRAIKKLKDRKAAGSVM